MPNESIPGHQLERISGDARKLAYQLTDSGPVFYDYQPGNGARYHLVLSLDSVLRGGPVPGRSEGPYLILTIINFGSGGYFRLQGTLSGEYLSQKLHLTLADGGALAYLLNEIAHYLRN
jgi:hypothetical protein